MARILVTGGCGFIGSAVVKSLCALKHDVCVLDSLAYGISPVLPAGATLLQGSVGDPDVLVDAFSGVDRCIHLAGTPVLDNPRAHAAATSSPFLSAIEPLFTAAARSLTPVIYASSAAVYGETDALPINEESPRHPLTAHGVEKLALEICAAQYGERTGLPSLGMRMFNVYGPGQNLTSPYCGVVRRFADTMLTGSTAVVFGDGSHTRDYVYIDDVVKCLLQAVELPLAKTDVVNICTGNGTSVLCLAKTFEEIASTELSLRFEVDPETEVSSSVGDPEKAARVYGFRLNTPVKVGVHHLLDSLRQLAS